MTPNEASKVLTEEDEDGSGTFLKTLTEDTAIEEGVFTPPPKEDDGRGLKLRKLSSISKRYDRGNKGYLDETEQVMRRMDSQGNGYISNEKIYEMLERQNDLTHKVLNMKRGIIFLVVFLVILALAMLGTAFAAATLAKDTSVNSSGALVDKNNGQPVSTSNAGVTYELAIGQGNDTSPMVSISDIQSIWANCRRGTTVFLSYGPDCNGAASGGRCYFQVCPAARIVEAPFGSDVGRKLQPDDEVTCIRVEDMFDQEFLDLSIPFCPFSICPSGDFCSDPPMTSSNTLGGGTDTTSNTLGGRRVENEDDSTGWVSFTCGAGESNCAISGLPTCSCAL